MVSPGCSVDVMVSHVCVARLEGSAMIMALGWGFYGVVVCNMAVDRVFVPFGTRRGVAT